MASKLIVLEEAAGMLGVSQEELNEMRSRSEIFGYRDGASWKFKMEEIERVAEERGINLGGGGGAGDELDVDTSAESPFAADDDDDALSLDDDADEDVGASSILVSEESLGQSGESTSSTIIGRSRQAESPGDSDLQVGGSDLELATGSDIAAASGPELGATESEVELVPDAAGSSVKLVAGGSDPISMSSESGLDLGTPSDLAMEGSAAGSSPGPSDSLALDDDLELGSDLGGGGSALELDDDEGDLVLGGSGTGSDLTLGSADSGINLTPTDSGLSLEEEPLDLGGSAVDSLELPEDDEMVALDAEPADPDAATQLKGDDEFLLTPVEDAGDDEESGSQVIALEESEGYDQEANTMLGADMQQQPGALVAEDPGLMGGDMGGFGAQPAGAAAAAQPMAPAAPMPAPAAVPEAPYSIWNVLALLFITLFLAFTGMMMMDLLRNMWSFDGSSDVNTALMDEIIKAFRLDP